MPLSRPKGTGMVQETSKYLPAKNAKNTRRTHLCGVVLTNLHDFQGAGIVENSLRQGGQGVVVEVQLRDGRETLECSRREAGEATVPDVAALRVSSRGPGGRTRDDHQLVFSYESKVSLCAGAWQTTSHTWPTEVHRQAILERANVRSTAIAAEYIRLSLRGDALGERSQLLCQRIQQQSNLPRASAVEWLGHLCKGHSPLIHTSKTRDKQTRSFLRQLK